MIQMLNIHWFRQHEVQNLKVSYQAELRILCGIAQWYSTFYVRVPPDIISLQLCTPKVVGT
jgi:hypothetical protein